MTRKNCSILFTILLLLAQAGMLVGLFHSGHKLFADEVTVVAEPVLATSPSWLERAWALTKNVIVDIIKQAFAYIHQTIILSIILWFFGYIRKKWTEISPKLFITLDKIMDKTDLDSRETLKKYINAIVTKSIEAVEAAFVLQETPHLSEENAAYYEEKERLSQDKAAAALALVLKDMAAGGLDKIATKNQSLDALLKDIMAAIELQLLNQQALLDEKDVEMSTGAGSVLTNKILPNGTENFTTSIFRMVATNPTDQKLKKRAVVMNKTITQAYESLPKHYLTAINSVVGRS